MAKQTQYERLLAALNRAGRRGMTYMELIDASGSTCPHKRLAEGQSYGRVFQYGKRLVYLSRFSRLVDGRRLRVIVMEKV